MKKHKNSKIIASVSFTVLMVLAGVALWWRMADSQNQMASNVEPSSAQEAISENQADSSLSIEEIGEGIFMINGVVTDVYDERHRDGDAAVVIDDEIEIIVEVAREAQLFDGAPKGTVEVFDIGQQVEAYVGQDDFGRFTIYGDEEFFVSSIES